MYANVHTIVQGNVNGLIGRSIRRNVMKEDGRNCEKRPSLIANRKGRRLMIARG
jgi:hypothetical protein